MKRWLKYTLLLLAGFVIFCLMLTAIVLTTFDNDDYRRLVIRGVRFLTGYSVTITGPFALELSAEPSLSVEAIRFEPGADGSLPPVTTIGKLHIQIALSPLLRGIMLIRKLKAEDVTMAVTIAEEAESEDARGSIGPAASDIEIPIMESVHLRNIHLDVIDAAADRTVEIRLRKFDIDDIRNTGPLFINGEGSVSGNDFKIDGRLGALVAMLKGEEPFPVALDLTSYGFELSVSGTVKDIADGEGLKLRLRGEANELSNLFKLLQMEVPPLGRLTLEAGIASDIEAPRVSYLDVKLSGQSGVEFSVNGSIANAISGEGANLEFSGSCEYPDIFKMLLPKDLPALSWIRVAGRLKEKQGEFAVQNLTVDALVKQGLAVSADGRIGLGDNFSEPAVNDLDVNLKLSAPTTALLKPYVIESLPEMGPLSAKARLTGPLTQLSLEDIAIKAGGSGPLHLNTQGRVGQLTAADDMTVSEMDLTVSLQARNLRLLTSAFGIEVPDFGSVSLRTRIRGSSERFELTEIDAHTAHVKGLKVGLSGKIALEQHKKNGLLGNLNLEARINAPTTVSAFAPLGITDMPHLKPLRASVRVEGTTEVLSLKNIALNIGHSSPLRLQVKGDVGRVPLNGDRPISNVKLSALFQAGRTSALSTLLGVSIPNLGPLNATVSITDRQGIIGLSDVNIRVGAENNASLNVTGAIASVLKDYDFAVGGIDLTVAARDLGLLPFSELLGQPLPDLGPLQIKASINDRSGNLDVESFNIRSESDEKAYFRLQGKILEIMDLQDLVLQATFETTSQPWVETYLKQPEADNMPLSGAINVRGAADGVIIEEIRFGTADKKRLALQAKGKLTNLSASPEADLQLVATVPDPAVIGSMVGVSLPPLNALAINGRLNSNAQKGGFEGEIRIGETILTSKVSGAFADERPRIDARFSTATVNLDNMGIYPETPTESSVQTSEPKSSKKVRLFDNTPLSFEALKALDFYFALDADKLIGRNVTIEKLDLDILLENGRLQIHPASMVYAAGFTSAEFVVDASGSTPEFTLKVQGEDIDIDDLLAYAHEPIVLSGALNLVVDLHSSGGSAREIASNLKGEFSMALENGRIRRIVDFLSIDAFDAVLTTVDRRKYTDLHCLVNKLQFQDGVGDIKILFMDSPKIKTKGAGNVNLAEETIDLVIHPEKKGKLFKKGSSIRINGPLANPSVRTLPLSEAAQLYGDIFMPYVTIPARALGYLWSLIKNDKEATPCVFDKR